MYSGSARLWVRGLRGHAGLGELVARLGEVMGKAIPVDRRKGSRTPVGKERRDPNHSLSSCSAVCRLAVCLRCQCSIVSEMDLVQLVIWRFGNQRHLYFVFSRVICLFRLYSQNVGTHRHKKGPGGEASHPSRARPPAEPRGVKGFEATNGVRESGRPPPPPH